MNKLILSKSSVENYNNFHKALAEYSGRAQNDVHFAEHVQNFRPVLEEISRKDLNTQEVFSRLVKMGSISGNHGGTEVPITNGIECLKGLREEQIEPVNIFLNNVTANITEWRLYTRLSSVELNNCSSFLADTENMKLINDGKNLTVEAKSVILSDLVEKLSTFYVPRDLKFLYDILNFIDTSETLTFLAYHPKGITLIVTMTMFASAYHTLTESGSFKKVMNGVVYSVHMKQAYQNIVASGKKFISSPIGATGLIFAGQVGMNAIFYTRPAITPNNEIPGVIHNIADNIRNHSDEFRPADNSFFWPVRRALGTFGYMFSSGLQAIGIGMVGPRAGIAGAGLDAVADAIERANERK